MIFLLSKWVFTLQIVRFSVSHIVEIIVFTRGIQLINWASYRMQRRKTRGKGDVWGGLREGTDNRNEIKGRLGTGLPTTI